MLTADASSNQALPVGHVRSMQSIPVYPELQLHTVAEHEPCPLQATGGDAAFIGQAELEEAS